MNIRLLLGFLIPCFLMACGGGENNDPIPVPYTLINGPLNMAPYSVADPSTSDLGDPSDATSRFFTFRDQAAFSNWWARNRNRHETVPSLAPSIDFSKQTIAAIYFGFRRNGGFDLKISSVVQLHDKVEVRYQEIMPLPGSTTTQAVTFPFKMIAIDKPNADVVYVEGEKILQ